MNGIDVYGNECREDHRCDFHGENFQWCYLKKGNKGSCSNVDTNEQTKTISSKGYYCMNECKKHFNNYYTCATLDGGSDHKIIHSFCSPSSKVDFQGNECKSSHQCDYHGKDFSWCYLKKGGWGHCSKDRSRHDLGISVSGDFCINECKRRDHGYFCSNNCGKFGNKSYSCEIQGGGWNYCSAGNQIDYKGNECKDNHKCDYYGEKYAWCYLKKGSWGYCSKSKAMEWDLDFKIFSCSDNIGKAIYKTFLYNYPKSLTADRICSILPVIVPGQGKIYAKNCYIEKDFLVGKIEVVFDELLDEKNNLNCS